jgi:hypothetical protein
MSVVEKEAARALMDEWLELKVRLDKVAARGGKLYSTDAHIEVLRERNGLYETVFSSEKIVDVRAKNTVCDAAVL